MSHAVSSRVLVASCLVFILAVIAGLQLIIPIPLPGVKSRILDNGIDYGAELTLRINEVGSIKRGVNPYLVLTEVVDLPPYRPWFKYQEKVTVESGKYAPIAAYTPWEYSILLPFSFLPRCFFWYCYLALNLFVLGLVFRFIYVNDSVAFDGIFRCSLCGLLVYPIMFDLYNGNYSILSLGALFAMCWCLNRNRQILAGLLWAFIMVKPQYGLILAVPLLLKRKFITIIVAALTCVALSVVPSVMCNASIIDLLVQVNSAGMSCFRPCALVPACVVDGLARLGCSESVAVYLGLGLGAAICAAFCWKLRFVKDWFVFMLPAVIMAVSWSYVLDHGYALCILPVFFASIYYIKYGDNRYKLMFMISLPFVCRFYNLAVRVGNQCCGLFPWLNFSKSVDNALNSYNSLIAMLFMLGFCILIIRKRIDWLVEKS